MNIIIKMIIVTLFFPIVDYSSAQSDFYYYNNKKIHLEISTNMIICKFDSAEGRKEEIKNIFANNSKIEYYEELTPNYAKGHFKLKLNRSVNSLNDIIELKNEFKAKRIYNVYSDNNIEAIPFGDFIIKFVGPIDYIKFNEFNKKNGVEIVDSKIKVDGKYRLRIVRETTSPLFKLAQLYYETFELKYSIPDLIYPIITCSTNDTYFSQQYYLHNTGQTGGVTDADIDAPEAWNISDGSSSVGIAIMDEGGVAHEDLPSSRMLQGFDAVDVDYTPTPWGNGNHGMACAGVIAATKNNNLGISGIAPLSKIMYLKILGPKGVFASHGYIADGIEHAYTNNIDIISNSWGVTSDNPNIFPLVREAIDDARTLGRNGKGCIIVAAAGNNANRPTNLGYLIFPANIPNVLTVGAIDKSKNIQQYSPGGDNNLNIVAPSGATESSSYSEECEGLSKIFAEPPIPNNSHRVRELNGDVWTIDYPGERGWYPGGYGICEPEFYDKFISLPINEDLPPTGNYTSHFGGTSAACPQAAGVAALILSINSDLTESQVRNIIQQSADDMGTSGYDTDFGYGRLNAYKALKYTLENYGGVLSGDIELTENLSIAAGKTLTISPGTNLTFKNNASLIIYGTLNVNGTSGDKVVFDFVSKSASNGIKVYSGGTANIEYAEIKNAKYGVYSNQGIVDIDNGDIHDCTYGVYCYNTNAASTDPVIEDTYVEDNSSTGIYLYKSSPTIDNCKINNNSSNGVYAYQYCDPELSITTLSNNGSSGIFGDYYCDLDFYISGGAKNLITGNSLYGIGVGMYSTTYSGSMYTPGQNSIYSNGSYEVAAFYSSNASMMTNYWGATSPPSGEFYADGSSSYSNLFWYSSDQGAGSSLPKSIIEEDDISLAYYNLDIGNYDEAEKIFKNVLDGEFDRNKSIYALSGLNKCFVKANKKGFKDFLKQELKSKVKDELASMYLELESYWLTEEGEYQKAIENFKKLQSDYKNDEEIVENAKLSEALIYLDNLGDKNKAEAIFAELSNKVRSTEKTDFLANCIEDYDEKNVSSKSSNWAFEEDNITEEITPTDYELFGNYPNPFNPSTTIKYSVPEYSNVSLAIYDMMGKEIRTFEYNGLTTGQHSTIWDGTNNNGVRVSSGVYIYKFRAVSLSGNGKVFEKASKLMLVK